MDARRYLFLLLVVFASTLAFGQKTPSQALKVGKQGQIVLKATVHMGGVTLQPGQYMLQHRVIGSDHYIRLDKMEVSTTPSEAYPQLVPTDQDVVKCKVEPARSKFKETRLITEKKGSETWVTKVEVAGENVVHVVE